MSEKPHSDDIPLSPSERAGLNTVNRVSGNRRGGGSTQAALGSIALGFQLIVIFLIGLMLFGLRRFDPPYLALIGAGVVCALSVIAIGTMRWPLGKWLGSLVQVLVFVSAVWAPAILVVAILFGGLWVYSMWKGAAIDHQKAVWRQQGLIP